MPVWLRLFTFNTMKEYYDKQNEEHKKQQNIIDNASNRAKNITKPNIPKPTYTSKAPKK